MKCFFENCNLKELSQLSRVYYLTRVINKKNRRTAGLDYYPTQIKPPLEPQLLLVDKLPPLSEPPSKAKTKIFFLVFWLWQAGQGGLWSASEKRNHMPESDRSIECGECGFAGDEPVDIEASKRRSCPNCGSLRRHVRLSYIETLVIHEKTKLKARSPGGGKPRYEAIEGDDLNRKTGIWMRLHRVIDRANNWYHERIIDTQTNTVVHVSDESLDKHIGHGSDKRRQNNKSNDAIGV